MYVTISLALNDGIQTALSAHSVNRPNENQHYVSRVLLNRFKSPGSPLFSYSIDKGEWKERSIEKACSAVGYNQWLENGNADNSFEACFSHVESLLPKTFRALEEAAKRKESLLDVKWYENLCRYCTMLKLSSPAAKAGAVAALTIQLNWEVENGKLSLLSFFEVPDTIISSWKSELKLGRRIILDCDNPAQFAFRVHYSRTCDVTFAEFLRCRWIIEVSPFDLPISDVGLVPIQLIDLKAHQYFLPIAPRLLLEGIFYFDEKRNSFAFARRSRSTLRNHLFVSYGSHSLNSKRSKNSCRP